MNLKKLEFNYKKHSLKIPYYELIGKKDGPHLFISGGMHGNEINGIFFVRKFLEWSAKNNLEEKMNGRITVLPIVNIPGFNIMQRNVPIDNKDLNRCFGIETKDSFSYNLANLFTEKIFKKCDLGIDVHDSGGRSELLPHIRVHKKGLQKENTIEIAKIFGLEYILLREGHTNMLAVHLQNHLNIPVLTIEIGGAQKIYKNFTRKMLTGFKNILAANKIYNSKVIIPKKQFLIDDRDGIYIREGAEISFKVKLGDKVKKNQVIGIAYFPHLQSVMEIESHIDGIIFSLWQQNQIPQHELIYSIIPDKLKSQDVNSNVLELSPLQINKIKL